MKTFFFGLRFLFRHYTGAKHVTSEDTGAKRLERVESTMVSVRPFVGPRKVLPMINEQDDQIVEISTNLKACWISCEIIDFLCLLT